MLRNAVDSLLASRTASRYVRTPGKVDSRPVTTAAGTVQLHDSGGTNPCVVLVPDGPNVIEHYGRLIALLTDHYRVVCFDMPGFGHSLPSKEYDHSLDQGAATVLAVLDALSVRKAVLAFSCANGLYAIRVAQIAPQRVSRLVLSQTPSLAAMHAWSRRVVPPVLHVPIIGQIVGWLMRHKVAKSWYRIALPKGVDAGSFERPALRALSCGGCFSLAGVVQGLRREAIASLGSIDTPCTMFWGSRDRSHQQTDPNSLKDVVPNAVIIRFECAGHFPDLEEPDRYAKALSELERGA